MNWLSRLKSWFGPKDDLPPGFHEIKDNLRPGSHTIKAPDGSICLVDQTFFDYLRSKAPAPTQISLDAVLDKLRKVRVYKGGYVGWGPMGQEILFETENDRDLAELKECLRIKDAPAGHCMCFGDPTMELLGEASQHLAVISLHHGRSIRWNHWKDDAELLNGLRVLTWLAERGVVYPREEYEKDLSHANAWERGWQRWLDAMPSCLRPFEEAMKGRLGWTVAMVAPDSENSASTAREIPEKREETAPGIIELQRVLKGAYPDGRERALGLLAWYGSGAGPWSPYPAYEETADKLILSIPIGDLVRALSVPGLSESQLEGGARFLAGPAARSLELSILAQLSEDTKKTYLNHVLRSTDEGKKKRALSVFLGKQ